MKCFFPTITKEAKAGVWFNYHFHAHHKIFSLSCCRLIVIILIQGSQKCRLVNQPSIQYGTPEVTLDHGHACMKLGKAIMYGWTFGRTDQISRQCLITG